MTDRLAMGSSTIFRLCSDSKIMRTGALTVKMCVGLLFSMQKIVRESIEKSIKTEIDKEIQS